MFFLPTKADMMPNVLIEAAAAQLPCLASKLGAISEIIEDDRTGWLVEPREWEEFYDRLQDFADQPDRFNAEDLRINAERFFDERMKEDFASIIFQN
jgi:glycosyltransferase involved in cell wall biosynthesis